MYKSISILSLAAGMSLVLAFTTPAAASGDHEGGHDRGFAFGQPAKGAEPDRTIDIKAADTMKFQPDQIEVRDGEVVRFVVKNTGSLHHSFTLGSSKWHQHHEEEMKGMPVDNLSRHMRGEPNGVVVPPGETRAFDWKFENDGSTQFGCRIPGHFPAGMKGSIDIG